MPNNPKRIGVTGGIGSGKSIVCQIFNTLGIPVYNADNRAKVLMSENPIVVNSIKYNFGEQAYLQNGILNREFLAKTVFGNKDKLIKINAIVHPAVALDFEKWAEDHKKSKYLVKEAALLVESGSYKSLDYLVLVTCPEELRIKRVLSRDQYRSRQQILDIISKQNPEEINVKNAQFKISNNGYDLLIPQVLNIHNKLISL